MIANYIKRVKWAYLGLIILVTCFFAVMLLGLKAQAAKPLVIVIDPGHGGENLGGQFETYIEKEMTPIVANAMKEELEKYEGVEVYLTHESDVDISIKDRAHFAKEKNADFLFCLHFNMSVNHNLFGAEVWVPATGKYYAKGYSFAQIQMETFTDAGLYSRGIKTRINDRNENYYGILRYGTLEDVPTVLIEHCHLDHEKDQPFYQQGEQQLIEFGIMDATAVAKYFGLKSEVLGVDYSDYPVPETQIPSGIVHPDETEPEVCRIQVTNIDEQSGEVTIEMEATDSDSYIMYYDYSVNGGNTYSELTEWPRAEVFNQSLDTYAFTIAVPFDTELEIRTNAYNGFDLFTESNVLYLDPIADPERLARENAAAEEEARIKAQENYTDVTYDMIQAEEKEETITPIIIILVLIVLAMIFVAFFMAKKIDSLIKGSRKR